MWWQDLLWGVWNGVTAWVILFAHVFGLWIEFPFYDRARNGNWYDFGFLLGAGSPFFGVLSHFANSRSRGRPPATEQPTQPVPPVDL